jgi:formyltetrahydrofolate-dependent phosphoribosylglycinamide formyltransferase
MTKQLKLVVLISGSGSNLQAIIDAIEAGTLPAEIVCVVSNRRQVYGLQRAEAHHLPTAVFPKTKLVSRAEYDEDLARFVASFAPDYVVMAGWMLLLSMHFLGRFPNRVINLHPALPGQFPGTHAIERAFEAYRRGEIPHTGIMVHLVPDEGVDDGPVLASAVVPILAEDSLETLEARVHAAEHRLLVETIRQLATGELALPAH